jgi:hypothetical protein
MSLDEFAAAIRRAAPEGTVLPNPGGGTTTIVAYTGEKLRYRRGRSTIYVSLRDLYDAYYRFRGKTVTSPELRRAAPTVFDSSAPHYGHSCNCAVFFMLLQQAGIVERIGGSGTVGDPFRVRIPGPETG